MKAIAAKTDGKGSVVIFVPVSSQPAELQSKPLARTWSSQLSVVRVSVSSQQQRMDGYIRRTQTLLGCVGVDGKPHLFLGITEVFLGWQNLTEIQALREIH